MAVPYNQVQQYCTLACRRQKHRTQSRYRPPRLLPPLAAHAPPPPIVPPTRLTSVKIYTKIAFRVEDLSSLACLARTCDEGVLFSGRMKDDVDGRLFSMYG